MYVVPLGPWLSVVLVLSSKRGMGFSFENALALLMGFSEFWVCAPFDGEVGWLGERSERGLLGDIFW